MSNPKKVYIHIGDMVHLMIVPECFSRDAAGYREQIYPQSILIRVHDTNRIAFADPITKQVKWDGGDMPRADLPPTLSACLAHPEVKALVDAAEQATDMLKNCTFQTMYMRGQYVDREEVVARAREALARIKDAKP
jgi:hypothetical protein